MMRNEKILFLFSWLTLLLFVSSDIGSTTAIHKSPMTLYKQDNGKEITVHVHDIFNVQLENAGGTGYSWNLDKLESKYIVLLEENVKRSDKSGIVGAPVTNTWKFEAKGKGKTSINLRLYRVWEGKENAIDRFRVHITID